MLLIIRILAVIFAIIGVLLSVCSIGYCIQDVFMEYSQGETRNGELDAPSHWKYWLKFFASFMSIFIHLAGLYGMKTRKPKFMWPWICAFAMASKVFVSLNYTLANLLYFLEYSATLIYLISVRALVKGQQISKAIFLETPMPKK